MNNYKKSILAIGTALALTSGMAFADSNAVATLIITEACHHDSKNDATEILANTFLNDTATLTINTVYKNNKTGGTVSVILPTSFTNATGDETIEFTSSSSSSESDGGIDSAYKVTRTETITVSNVKAKKADTYTALFTYTCTPGS